MTINMTNQTVCEARADFQSARPFQIMVQIVASAMAHNGMPICADKEETSRVMQVTERGNL